MFASVSGVVLGLLGIAASANWLTGSEVRRARTIRHEAELLALLPLSPSRDALHHKIQLAVWRHVRLSNNKVMVRKIKLLGAGWGITMATAPVGIVSSAFLMADQDWARPIALASLGVMVPVLAGTEWLRRTTKNDVDELLEAGAPINRVVSDYPDSE